MAIELKKHPNLPELSGTGVEDNSLENMACTPW